MNVPCASVKAVDASCLLDYEIRPDFEIQRLPAPGGDCHGAALLSHPTEDSAYHCTRLHQTAKGWWAMWKGISPEPNSTNNRAWSRMCSSSSSHKLCIALHGKEKNGC